MDYYARNDYMLVYNEEQAKVSRLFIGTLGGLLICGIIIDAVTGLASAASLCAFVASIPMTLVVGGIVDKVKAANVAQQV